ncbi:MAG TPA: hypothetical protein VKY56_01065 [Chloroflexota bacterium]|nr:hypothetical protein [Chloroflexota bacterium]
MYAERTWQRGSIASAWQTPWLLSKRWDLTYISLSAILVPVPFLLYQLFSRYGVPGGIVDPVGAVDILVAIAVGGPHMCSTYTLTFMNRNFTRRYPVYVGFALLLPVLVTILGLVNLTLLLTVFMMWASVHVLHQIAYIADCYRVKGNDYQSLFSRLIDYGVIFTSLYPMAVVKLVANEFVISGTRITIPFIVGQYWCIYAAHALFFSFLALFIAKTALEVQQRRANFPKTLLMVITICLAYIVPSARNLDVAFQGMNVWHSFQYLGLTWYLNRLRLERGEVTSEIVRRITSQERGLQFYLFNVGLTLSAGVMAVLLNVGLGLPWIQSYYIVILSCLLIHYYFDHFLFTRIQEMAGAT